ncbi:hypothetical protein ACOMHN_026244 [Nucella lapillus]
MDDVSDIVRHVKTVTAAEEFWQTSSSAPTRRQFPGQICSHNPLPPPLPPHDDSSRGRWTDLFSQPSPSSSAPTRRQFQGSVDISVLTTLSLLLCPHTTTVPWTDLFSQPSPSSSAPTRRQFHGQICSHNPLPPPLPPHDNSSLDRSVHTALSLLLCPHTTTVPWTDLFTQLSPSSSAPTRQQFHNPLPPPLSPHDDSSRCRWTELFTQPAPSSASQASTATTGRGRAEMLRRSTCY